MFGLTNEDIRYLENSFKEFPEIEEVKIFGSRAVGKENKGSDIDLSAAGLRVTHQTVLSLKDKLNEESPLPYFFDVLNYSDLTNENLKNEIESEGVVIFSRK